MNERDFCYWLQGYMENVNPNYIDEATTKSIKYHLSLVFNMVTPKTKYFGTSDGPVGPSVVGPDELFTRHTGIKDKLLC